MKTVKKIVILLLIFFPINSTLLAETPHYIDFKFILNESNAGKKAQLFLKNKLDKGVKNIQAKQKKLQEDENQIIKQKKVISAEDYKKKVADLRNKVSNLQRERNTLLESVAKQRTLARKKLLESLNPIIKDYMKDKNIKMVIDKKSLLLADESLNITKDIMTLLNDKLKSINLK